MRIFVSVVKLEFYEMKFYEKYIFLANIHASGHL